MTLAPVTFGSRKTHIIFGLWDGLSERECFIHYAATKAEADDPLGSVLRNRCAILESPSHQSEELHYI